MGSFVHIPRLRSVCHKNSALEKRIAEDLENVLFCLFRSCFRSLHLIMMRLVNSKCELSLAEAEANRQREDGREAEFQQTNISRTLSIPKSAAFDTVLF